MAKVRIRKAGPGEKPGYYNRTSQFLKKAQEGMQVQEEGQTTQEDMMQAYYQYAYGQLSNQTPPDKVYTALISNGLPEQVAYQMITQLMDKLVDEGVINPDYKREKEAQEQQEQAAQDAQAAEPEAQQVAADQQQEDQSMYEEQEDMNQLEEDYLQDRSYMQDGGDVDYSAADQYMSQFDQVKDTTSEPFRLDEMIANTPGIQPGMNFPDLAEYIPGFEGAQWEPMDALQSTPMEMQREGGPIKKKQFVKNVMALLKKQAGGEGEEQEDTALGKGDRMDTLTEDVKKHKNNFLSAVKNKATQIKTEEMYDKLQSSGDPELQQLGMQNAFQTGGMTGGDNPLYRFIGGGEDPDFYEADFLPEAAYGYSTGNLRRAQTGDAGKKYKVITLMVNPPIYQVVDENNKEVFRSPDMAQAQAFANGETPGQLPVNTQGMSRAEIEALIQEQLKLAQQQAGQVQPQQRVNAQGVPIAKINYIPNYVTGPGMWYRNVLPWNPLRQVSRFPVQVGMPHYYGSNVPYADPLAGMKPIARQVTKRGIFGRPKTWTDIYAPGYETNDTGDIIMDGGKMIFPGQPIPSKAKSPLPGKDKAEAKEVEKDFENVDRKGRLVHPRETSGRELTPKRLARMEEKGRKMRIKGEEAYQEMFGHPTTVGGRELPSEYKPVESQHVGRKPKNRWLAQKPKSQEEIIAEWEKAHNYKRDGNTFTYKDLETGNTQQGIIPTNFSGSGSTNFHPAIGFYAYGGYLPEAEGGLTINDPKQPQPGPANPDLALGNQVGLIGSTTQGPNSLWGIQQSFNQPAPTSPQVQAYNNNPANNMVVEPMGDDLSQCTPEQKRDTTSKCYCTPEARKNPNDKRCYEGTNMIAVDFATGKSKTTDPEAMVNVFNAGVRGVTGLLNRKDERRRQQQMYDNLTSDNLYTAQATRHRGDWVDLGSQAGQYRFDQMGQDRSGFSSYGKFGGYMQDGGESAFFPEDSMGYAEGDEVYMTDDEIKNFMAQGGQVEYL